MALVLADDPAEDAPRAPTLTLVRGDISPAARPTTRETGPTRRRGVRSAHPSDTDTDTDTDTASDTDTDITTTDPADWALPLEALLDSDGDADLPVEDTGEAELALQFELIVTPQASGRRSAAVGPGIA